MAVAESFQDQVTDGLDALAGEIDDIDEGDELSGIDEVEDDALEALADEAIDESSDVDDLVDDEYEALADADDLDELADDADTDDVDAAACEDCDALEDFGSLGTFGYDRGSGLYTQRGPMLVSGPAAVAMASRLNPFILEQMDADDADAFFKSIGRAFGGIARGVSGAVSRVAKAAPGILKAVGPLIARAVPMIQQVAGKLGPWGALVSAGLGAAKGLAEGKGLSGALQGALSGAVAGIPGVGSVVGRLGGAGGLLGGLGKAVGGGGLGSMLGRGGPLGSILGAAGGKGGLGSVLGAFAPSGGAQGGLGGLLGGLLGGGDGADEDADLDALADLCDVRRIAPAVALPIGAGLAARTVARKGVPAMARIPGKNATLWRPAKQAERILLRAASRARGTAGQRLRLMRAIARLAVLILRRRGGNSRQIPGTVRWAANRILGLARGTPGLGRVRPAIAAHKLAARRQILRKVPMAAICRGTARAAA